MQGSTKKSANKKSAIPVRRTKSAPNSVHISDHMGTGHKHQDRNRKNAKAEVRVEDTTKAVNIFNVYHFIHCFFRCV